MKLRIVLLLLTLPPMIAFATLGAYLCVQSWTKMSVAKESANIAETAEEISALVHNLQVERGMSAGYLASGGVNFAGELEGKRQSTDYAATDLKNKSAKLTAMFGDGWGELVQKLGGLGDIRQSVNGLALKPAQAGFEYTQIISGLLSLQAEKLATTTDPTLLHYGAGMLGIDYAKEAAGLERAAGATGLGADSFPPQVYDKFTALSVRQEATLQVAGQSLGDFELYDRLMMTDEAMAVFAYRKAIRSYASGNGAPPVASEWFAASTEWVNRLRQEGLSVSSILVQTANKVEQNAIWVFSLTIGSAVTLTIGCLGLTIFYSRRLSGQIGELRAAMARLAEKD
ncbi:MAG: nitrate- and nitrite sensing domain-containing protein, partial [Mangrovicoccus sp.]